MPWSPESIGDPSGLSPLVPSDTTKTIIQGPTQVPNYNFIPCSYTTNVPPTPASAPPIPILISTDDGDKAVKDIFFPPGFSSDMSVAAAVQQQKLLSQQQNMSSVIIPQQEEHIQYLRNSSSPTSITKHLQSLRPVLCNPAPTKMEEHQENTLSSPTTLQQNPPLPSPSENEFRNSQLKIVSNGTSSAVSGASYIMILRFFFCGSKFK